MSHVVTGPILASVFEKNRKKSKTAYLSPLLKENEARSGSQKRIFRKAARTLFVPVDCVLCISRPYFAYEKCSPDIGDSNDMKKSDIRRINRNICKEKANFIDFRKLIPRFVRSESHSF